MNNLNQDIPICFTTFPVSETELRDETDDLDLQRFSFIFGNYQLSKNFLRQLIGKLTHAERLSFEDDICWSAKIVRILSPAYLKNAITFLKDCRVQFFKTEFEQYRAIQKFQYRLNFKTNQIFEREVVSFVDYSGRVVERLYYGG